MVIEAGKEQLGFTYLAVLFFVAVAGIGLGAAGLTWATMQQREKEKELLFVGNQFRMAIGRYYNSTPGSIKRYPARLTELLKDNRHLAPQRYLRKIYIDPMTATTDWGLVHSPDGGIMGVYSKSNAAPIKHSGFRERDAGLEGKRSYRDWEFTYQPPRASGQS